MTEQRKIEPGDQVLMKGHSSPKMVVESIDLGNDAKCSWFTNGNEYKSVVINVVALVRWDNK